MACTCQATMGGKFAPLIGPRDEDMDINSMITTYNTAVTDAASETLGMQKKQRGSPEMVLTSVVRAEIGRKSWMKQEQKSTRKQTGGFRRQ